MTANVIESVDNTYLAAKLALRRHFLDRYHQEYEPKVFDACQGDGVIWKQLRSEYPIGRYWGVDVKRKAGRLTIDSTRILAFTRPNFDIVDVDTYGNPWAHWAALLPNIERPCTVFLTVGFHNQASTPANALGALGIPASMMKLTPHTIRHRLVSRATDACLALALKEGLRIVEAMEAIVDRGGGGMTRYIGLRLERP